VTSPTPSLVLFVVATSATSSSQLHRMSSSIQSIDEDSMVHNDHKQDLTTIPREVFLSCASVQSRTNEIQQKTFDLIEDSILGDASRVETIIAQICPKKKMELELMAHVIVSKALDEPQYCKACVSLSGALRLLLPALPSVQQGKKGETFMHALLDVFQTEFEGVMEPSCEQTFENEGTFSNQETTSPSCVGHWATQKNHNRIRAIVHFAGHLYCHGLLGNGVVNQMVQDLVDNGASESANELYWFIGALNNDEQRNLGTVLEDVGDSDGASSESVSTSERKPSCP